MWDYPKSKATLKLEGLLADLRKLQEGVKVGRGKDHPEEDCFCQGKSIAQTQIISIDLGQQKTSTLSTRHQQPTSHAPQEALSSVE